MLRTITDLANTKPAIEPLPNAHPDGARPGRPHHVIHGIDALRFTSAVLVVLFHLGFWISRPGTTPYVMSGGHFSFPRLAPIVAVGRMGVEIFFVVSGFVIAYSAQRATAASFLRGRVLRLAPGAWVCATATLAFTLAYGHDDVLTSVGTWVRSITFNPYGPYIDTVYWTLAIEMSFYAVILALIYFDALDQIDRVFLVVATLSTGFCVLIFIVEPRLQILVTDRTLKLGLIVNGAQFAVGVFLWQLLYKGSSPTRWAGLAIGLVGGALETAKFVTQHHDRILASVLWLVAIGAIVASVHWNHRIATLLGARGRALLRGAGLATYPLYLLHQVIGAAIMGSLARAGMPPVACLIVAVVVLTGAAWFVAVKIEPVIRQRFIPLLNPAHAPVRRGEAPGRVEAADGTALAKAGG